MLSIRDFADLSILLKEFVQLCDVEGKDPDQEYLLQSNQFQKVCGMLKNKQLPSNYTNRAYLMFPEKMCQNTPDYFLKDGLTELPDETYICLVKYYVKVQFNDSWLNNCLICNKWKVLAYALENSNIRIILDKEHWFDSTILDSIWLKGSVECAVLLDKYITNTNISAVLSCVNPRGLRTLQYIHQIRERKISKYIDYNECFLVSLKNINFPAVKFLCEVAPIEAVLEYDYRIFRSDLTDPSEKKPLADYIIDKYNLHHEKNKIYQIARLS